MGAVVLALVLAAVLVAVALAFAWQERRSVPETVTIYGVEDAIAFIEERLSEGSAAEVRPTDIRRILEWEMKYIQNPRVRTESDEPTVVGGINAARYVQERSVAAGTPYDGPVILEVLELQAEYLAAIGAVGEAVEGGERTTVLRESGEDFDG